jgi:hypothetical protein
MLVFHFIYTAWKCPVRDGGGVAVGGGVGWLWGWSGVAVGVGVRGGGQAVICTLNNMNGNAKVNAVLRV